MFHELLLEIRNEKGFRSALSFYKHFAERGAIIVNYPQYKKIELGTAHPQPEFVKRLAKALPEYAERLVRTFCRDLFPEQENLFSIPSHPMFPSAPPGATLLYRQDELTPKQVSIIAKSEVHYAFYLVSTLGRSAVTRDEYQRSITDFSDQVLEDFIQSKLLYEEQGAYRSSSAERSFPKPDSDAMKKAYSRMDQWDLTIHEWLKTEKVIKTSIFRRVSPRYIPILAKQAELLIDQFKASDETDLVKNSEVMSLFMSIRKGRLPG